MYLVERHFVKRGDDNFIACKRLCFRAAKVKNSANYELRKSFFDGDFIGQSKADKIIKTERREVYNLLSASASQRCIQILGDSWKSWFAAIKSYSQDPSKFEGKPKIPGYSKGASTFYVSRSGFCIKKGRLIISKADSLGYKPIKIVCCKEQPFNPKAELSVVEDVRIVPMGTSFIVEIVYKKPEVNLNLNPQNAFGIDLGIDNLMTIVSNQQGIAPVLIKGKAIKSINAKYNKDKAKLASQGKKGHILSKSRKRYCKINDYFHKVSHWLICECARTNTGTIVIGKNEGWKKSVNIGKMNNQKFVSIPHNALIDKIKYKAEMVGIKVIVREESYTSKASALDLDDIPTYQLSGANEKPEFSGRRVKRGLYRSEDKTLINADVNGAANILRKEIGNDWLISQIKSNKGVVDTPIAINHIDLLLEKSPRTLETPSKSLAA